MTKGERLEAAAQISTDQTVCVRHRWAGAHGEVLSESCTTSRVWDRFPLVRPPNFGIEPAHRWRVVFPPPQI